MVQGEFGVVASLSGAGSSSVVPDEGRISSGGAAEPAGAIRWPKHAAYVRVAREIQKSIFPDGGNKPKKEVLRKFNAGEWLFGVSEDEILGVSEIGLNFLQTAKLVFDNKLAFAFVERVFNQRLKLDTEGTGVIQVEGAKYYIRLDNENSGVYLISVANPEKIITLKTPEGCEPLLAMDPKGEVIDFLRGLRYELKFVDQLMAEYYSKKAQKARADKYAAKRAIKSAQAEELESAIASRPDVSDVLKSKDAKEKAFKQLAKAHFAKFVEVIKGCGGIPEVLPKEALDIAMRALADLFFKADMPWLDFVVKIGHIHEREIQANTKCLLDRNIYKTLKNIYVDALSSVRGLNAYKLPLSIEVQEIVIGSSIQEAIHNYHNAMQQSTILGVVGLGEEDNQESEFTREFIKDALDHIRNPDRSLQPLIHACILARKAAKESGLTAEKYLSDLIQKVLGSSSDNAKPTQEVKLANAVPRAKDMRALLKEKYQKGKVQEACKTELTKFDEEGYSEHLHQKIMSACEDILSKLGEGGEFAHYSELCHIPEGSSDAEPSLLCGGAAAGGGGAPGVVAGDEAPAEQTEVGVESGLIGSSWSCIVS